MRRRESRRTWSRAARHPNELTNDLPPISLNPQRSMARVEHERDTANKIR
jgi:hypothetical protein